MAHPSDYPMSVPQDFSNLEVAFRRTDEGFKEVQRQPGRLLIPSDILKEVHSPETSTVSYISGTYHDESRLSANSPPSALSSAGSFTNLLPDKEWPTAGDAPTKRICGLSAKGFWLLLALTLVAIAVAVGIPVGLYVRKKTAAPPSPTGSSLDIASTPSLGSAASSSSASAPPASRDASSGLASVAWNDTNGVIQYRVYFQDDQQSIKEFAWNASNNQWRETQTIGAARAKTPITAAVTGPQDFAFELSVYALGDNGSIIEWTSKDTETFESGNLTSQNIKPANVSSLTALWDRHHGCPQCANTLLFAYERSDGKLEIGNYTQQGWDWTTLQSNPAPGTGLALALRWQSTASGDIRLFYQIKDGHLVSQDYNGPRSPPAFTWLSRETGPVAQLNSISPLTSFTWGTTNFGDALYNDMISANASGLTVNYWDGVYNLNGNGAIPPSLASVDATALAANGDAHVYVLQQNGTIAEFQMLNDVNHWTYVGNINTG